MTLLNTVSNLGTNWPNTLALWAIDNLTYKTGSLPELGDNTCSYTLEAKTAVCIVVGFLWLQWGRPTINRLQRLPPSAWQIARHNR
ncbi:Acetyl-coenzyme A transporter 1 [Operophtera brumata]|uniref:Acetyl-coenzyme A transporter 1 n=1 Tax=Operophtera brumata TaxID=104452 RepID=A0A0L7LB18_OPEBR|nr:Acetyl-coenzyme A transporter 1 [Operophtera brumata]